MDLLDTYAAAALTGFCANGFFAGKPDESNDQRVKMVWAVARKMLDARNDAFSKGNSRDEMLAAIKSAASVLDGVLNGSSTIAFGEIDTTLTEINNLIRRLT